MKYCSVKCYVGDIIGIKCWRVKKTTWRALGDDLGERLYVQTCIHYHRTFITCDSVL